MRKITSQVVKLVDDTLMILKKLSLNSIKVAALQNCREFKENLENYHFIPKSLHCVLTYEKMQIQSLFELNCLSLERFG